MKILQLGKFYPIKGGVEKVAYDLMVGLSERGIDCDMMCTAAPEYPPVIKINEHGKVICCYSSIKVAATTLSGDMIKQLRRKCNDYDIIHIHHPDPMACLALRLSGYKGKVVLHWHSDILKQKILLRFYSPLQKWLISRADKIVGTSPVYVEHSTALKKVQHKTTYLPIGVKQIELNQSSIDIEKKKYFGKKIVFSLGRLVEYKGYKYLIDAAKFLNDDYIIIIAGEGPLEKDLTDQIKALGLENKVILKGPISDEQRATYYGLCDVFCLSSIIKTEAFAIVQVEAMSCATPVVATKIPGSGVSWVNKHGVSGLNAEPANAKNLATAIMDICENEKTHAEFSARARARYYEFFTEQRMIDNCIDIYEDLF